MARTKQTAKTSSKSSSESSSKSSSELDSDKDFRPVSNHDVLCPVPIWDNFKTVDYTFKGRDFTFGIFRDENKNVTYPLPYIRISFTSDEKQTDKSNLNELEQQYPNHIHKNHTYYSFPVVSFLFRAIYKTELVEFTKMVFSKLYNNLTSVQTFKISHNYITNITNTTNTKKCLCIHTNCTEKQTKHLLCHMHIDMLNPQKPVEQKEQEQEQEEPEEQEQEEPEEQEQEEQEQEPEEQEPEQQEEQEQEPEEQEEQEQEEPKNMILSASKKNRKAKEKKQQQNNDIVCGVVLKSGKNKGHACKCKGEEKWGQLCYKHSEKNKTRLLANKPKKTNKQSSVKVCCVFMFDNKHKTRAGLPCTAKGQEKYQGYCGNHNPEKKKSNQTSRTKCSHTKKNKEQCTKNAKNGHNKCGVHYRLHPTNNKEEEGEFSKYTTWVINNVLANKNKTVRELLTESLSMKKEMELEYEQEKENKKKRNKESMSDEEEPEEEQKQEPEVVQEPEEEQKQEPEVVQEPEEEQKQELEAVALPELEAVALPELEAVVIPELEPEEVQEEPEEELEPEEVQEEPEEVQEEPDAELEIERLKADAVPYSDDDNDDDNDGDSDSD